MKKISSMLATACLFTACNKTNEINKDMTQLSFTTEQAAAMTAIACNEAKGDLVALEPAIHSGLDAGLTINQVKEALSQLYAYTGFPRSLNALGVLQKIVESQKSKVESIIEGKEASPLPSDYDALREGTRVQTMLTGQPFNYDFAPQEDYYLKAHLFGDIFARDILTYADRELITVSALAGLGGVEPQLKAHIAGARNMGVTEEQLQGIVVALTTNSLFTEAGCLAKAYDELSTHNSTTSLNSQPSTLNSPWPQGQPNTAYAQFFVGNSYLHPYYGGVANVTFEPRCRNNWHIHHGAVQVLVCVSGNGWYQEWGKPAVPLTPGTVIAIPEGIKHWHGAAADSWLQHLAIHTREQSGASNEWLEPVSDEQYRTAEKIN